MLNAETPTFLRASSDIIFKIFFGDKRNEVFLAALLKAILKLPDEEFEELIIMNPELLKEYPGDKLGILDVKVKTKTGRILNIEIQVDPIKNIRERIIYYNSKMITEQIGEGENYSKIQQAVSILITSHKLINEREKYHHRFVLYDKEDDTIFTDKEEIYTIELPKLPKETDGTELYNWAKFLSAKNEGELEMAAEQSAVVKKAAVKLMELSADERTRMLYEAREKERRDNQARLSDAREEGREEGKLEAAKNALRRGFSVEDISEITNLPLETIQRIKAELIN